VVGIVSCAERTTQSLLLQGLPPEFSSLACHRFEANQFRLLLHSAAYVLLETLRREVLRTTQWASATMETIQIRLLKLGARVHEFQDRIKISLPSSCPVAPVLRRSLLLLACVRLTAA
jgi:Transposase DDE domain group 1